MREMNGRNILMPGTRKAKTLQTLQKLAKSPGVLKVKLGCFVLQLFWVCVHTLPFWAWCFLLNWFC